MAVRTRRRPAGYARTRRRPSRYARPRRKYRSYAFTRTACFGPAVLAPVSGWAYLHEPLDIGGPHAAAWHLAGLAVMLLAGLAVIPALFVSLVCFAPDLPKQAVPRSWRASYRSRHGRTGAKSSHITAELRRTVFTADRHRCIWCGIRAGDYDERTGAPAEMNVDHRIPWAWGGLTILFNCFTLCGYCNVLKCDYHEIRGRPHYSRHFDTRNMRVARGIFRRERRLQWNPFRMFRIAWSLGT